MSGRRLAGAVAGGLVAGLGITALLVAGERKTGKPSELAQLERATADKLGFVTPPADRVPARTEQAVIQGGHLALSAAAAGTYALATGEETGVVVSGIGFGLVLYAVAHWLLGPLLKVKSPEWKAEKAVIGMHTANHLVFGLITAAAARAARRAWGEVS